MMVKCQKCGVEFDAKRSNRLYCDECRKQMNRDYNRELRRSQSRFDHAEKACIYCGTKFTPATTRQVTCCNPECQKKLRHDNHLKRKNKMKQEQEAVSAVSMDKVSPIQKYYIQLWYENQGDTAERIAQVLPLSQKQIQACLDEGVSVIQRHWDAYEAKPTEQVYEIHARYLKRLARRSTSSPMQANQDIEQLKNTTSKEESQHDPHIVPTKRGLRKSLGAVIR